MNSWVVPVSYLYHDHTSHGSQHIILREIVRAHSAHICEGSNRPGQLNDLPTMSPHRFSFADGDARPSRSFPSLHSFMHYITRLDW